MWARMMTFIFRLNSASASGKTADFSSDLGPVFNRAFFFHAVSGCLSGSGLFSELELED